jgi:site-specific recombinase XerD
MLTESVRVGYTPAHLEDQVPRDPIPSDLMSAFLDYVRSRRAPLTLDAYRHDLHTFRTYLEETGHIPRKREIGPTMLDGYLSWLRDRQHAPATIERRLQALKSFFDWSVKRAHLTKSPFLLWDLPRAKDRLPRALSWEEDARMLAALETWPVRAFDRMVVMGVRLGRYAGLRVGECNRLTWVDVDWHKARLLILRSKGDEDRDVPMPRDGLVAPLRAWWTAAGEPSRGSVLTGLYGQPLPLKCLSRAVQRLYSAARIRDASFHTLRSTYATRLDELGVYPSVIQKLLGHKSMETTMRYISVAEERKRSAVDLLDTSLT